MFHEVNRSDNSPILANVTANGRFMRSADQTTVLYWPMSQLTDTVTRSADQTTVLYWPMSQITDVVTRSADQTTVLYWSMPQITDVVTRSADQTTVLYWAMPQLTDVVTRSVDQTTVLYWPMSQLTCGHAVCRSDNSLVLANVTANMWSRGLPIRQQSCIGQCHS